MWQITLLVSIAAVSFATTQIVGAQSIRIGPGGVSLDFAPPPPPPPPAVIVEEPPPVQLIGRREAGEIARSEGMIEIVSIDRDDSRYVVRGLDEVGARMRVMIDGVNGAVIETVRRQAAVVVPAPPPEVELEEEPEPPAPSRRARPYPQPAPYPGVQKSDPRPLNVRRDAGDPRAR
jgi:hypothetical protein